jgi:DNA-binding Lrp family transcriptional regulator
MPFGKAVTFALKCVLRSHRTGVAFSKIDRQSLAGDLISLASRFGTDGANSERATPMGRRRLSSLDRIDVKILATLQRHGRSTNDKLSRTIGLSARACLERVRKLEAVGIIVGYQAMIDIAKVSRPINVFAEITLERQANQNRFERRLIAIEEVVECWEVSGAVDYLARVVCADLGTYGALTSRLIDDSNLGVARIVSHIALRPIRRFSGYPESLLVAG